MIIINAKNIMFQKLSVVPSGSNMLTLQHVRNIPHSVCNFIEDV